jgi:riboflavin kinase/FMN adenylyltransferase
VPTANLSLCADVRPALGVYAGVAVLPDGTCCRAAINVGTNPTFTGVGAPVTVEAHLLDYDGDLYGKIVRLELTTRLRAETKFDGKDALVAQIKADIGAARVAELAPLPPID